MSVDSYIELFTTLYGWLFYNIVWEVLVGTGIAFIPFIGIVIDNVLDAYKNNEGEDAAIVALRLIEVDVIIAFIVIIFAASPFFTLQATGVSYTPPGILGAPPVSGKITAATNAQSTFATVSFVGHPNSADVPPWWYGVAQLGSGVNRAIMEGVPAVLDYRNYLSEINTMEIKDGVLRGQVNDFYRDCFVPARSKYQSEQPTGVTITALQTTHGLDDTDWIGSRIYLSTAQYYNTLRSSKIIEPFLYSASRDIEWDAGSGDVLPLFGRPTCKQWWSGIAGVNGIKTQLVNELSYFDGLMAIYENGFATTAIRQDMMIKKLLSLDSRAGIFIPRGYDLAYNNKVSDSPLAHWIERSAKEITTSIGASSAGIILGMFLDIFLRGAPMIQALILMGITTLLPFLLIVGRYKLSLLMAGALAWYSVKFWTVLWYFAFWVDQNLIIALFPDSGSLLMSEFADFNNRIILNVVTGMMYIALPLIFTMLMSIAGFSGGRQLDGLASTMSTRMSGRRTLPSSGLPKGKGSK